MMQWWSEQIARSVAGTPIDGRGTRTLRAV